MRDLNALSGPWSGFWIQHGIRGCMRLRLNFGKGKISGSGADFIGPFSIAGTFKDLDGNVAMLKRYPTHEVVYLGRWDGAMIFGTWEIPWEDESGEFEIWPEGEELSLESLELETREQELVETR